MSNPCPKKPHITIIDTNGESICVYCQNERTAMHVKRERERIIKVLQQAYDDENSASEFTDGIQYCIALIKGENKSQPIVSKTNNTISEDVDVKYVFTESWGKDWDNNSDYPKGQNK